MRILSDVLEGSRLRIDLGDADRERLYMEILHYFGLAGGLNVCEALEAAWRDPYNRREIEEFIKAWLRRKIKKRMETITGIV